MADHKVHDRSQLLIQRLISYHVLDELAAKQIAILHRIQVQSFLGVVTQNQAKIVTALANQSVDSRASLLVRLLLVFILREIGPVTFSAFVYDLPKADFFLSKLLKSFKRVLNGLICFLLPSLDEIFEMMRKFLPELVVHLCKVRNLLAELPRHRVTLNKLIPMQVSLDISFS